MASNRSSRLVVACTLVALSAIAYWYYNRPKAILLPIAAASSDRIPTASPFKAEAPIQEDASSTTASAPDLSAPVNPAVAPAALSRNSTNVATTDAPSLPKPAETGPTGASVDTYAAHREEVEGSMRMVAAHSVLRSPEVTNPDSAANKKILQEMFTKAVAQQAQHLSK